MRPMSLDFSKTTELLAVARVIGALEAVAAPLKIDHFLMGATARDLMTHYAHGVPIARGTRDVDSAVMVKNWCLKAFPCKCRPSRPL